MSNMTDVMIRKELFRFYISELHQINNMSPSADQFYTRVALLLVEQKILLNALQEQPTVLTGSLAMREHGQ